MPGAVPEKRCCKRGDGTQNQCKSGEVQARLTANTHMPAHTVKTHKACGTILTVASNWLQALHRVHRLYRPLPPYTLNDSFMFWNVRFSWWSLPWWLLSYNCLIGQNFVAHPHLYLLQAVGELWWWWWWWGWGCSSCFYVKLCIISIAVKGKSMVADDSAKGKEVDE